MNEALNQDTGPHESRQQLSWRRGMGPSVAAYEWLTDSQCFWHQLKKCEEVVKIRAAARCTSSPQSKSSKPKYAARSIRHPDVLQNCRMEGGLFFLVPETWKIFPTIHPLHLYSFSGNCLLSESFFVCVKSSFKRTFVFLMVLCFECLVTGRCTAEWFIAFYDGHWHFVWSWRDNLINWGPKNRKLILV